MKIMKKFFSIMMAGAIGMGAFAPTYAASKDNITVNVDGNKMQIVGHPAVLDTKTGRVMIPFKSLFLAIGVPEKDIKWDAATSTAKGTKDGTVVELTKNSKSAKVDGVAVEMDNAPIIMGTSMMVPLSFVTKQMGGQTQWIGAPSYRVEISMSSGLFPIDPPNSSITPPSTTTGIAPDRDTGTKNSEIWGTFAMNNMKKEKIVVQFKSDFSLDIKNISTGAIEKGAYGISGTSVNITSNLLGGNYVLSSTIYSGTTYYILKSSDTSKTLAMTAITYEQFASVF
ncbi:MAG: copper amine oxidase N-terminal domain-containing protein [Peptostreptococcaceae bacterium]|nr:copper amine oxidase N-terminal domain-containing protein [Peptostreptococcaceae bacterium]